MLYTGRILNAFVAMVFFAVIYLKIRDKVQEQTFQKFFLGTFVVGIPTSFGVGVVFFECRHRSHWSRANRCACSLKYVSGWLASRADRCGCCNTAPVVCSLQATPALRFGTYLSRTVNVSTRADILDVL